MMDLIDRAVLFKSMNILFDKEHFQNWSNTAWQIVQDQPTIEAVPLDKLCEWLAGNAWHLDCSDCDAEHCDCPQWHDDSGSSPEFWKAKLTKWMEETDA